MVINKNKIAVLKKSFLGVTKALTVVCIAGLYSCSNIGSNVEQSVNEQISQSKDEMDEEINKAKTQFITTYTAALNRAADSGVRQKLQSVYSTITQTGMYLDSVKKEMDKLDANNVRNVEHVKSTFLNAGVGDSLFNKLRSSIQLTEEAAASPETKTTIANKRDSIFSEPDTQKWKQQYFGLTNPLGASMILYGFQTELYEIGMQGLKGY